jgi:hypothetical protein
MDYITKFYKNKAESLTEQVEALEAKLNFLQQLNESEAPPMIFSGTGKGQKAFSDEELRDQMRKNKLTSLFKNYTEEEQTQEYKDAAAELARRQRAKETASQKGSESRTTVATPTASRPSVSGTQAQVAAAQKPTVGGTKAPTTQKAPAPTQQTGAGVEGVGKPSVTSTGKPATTETGTSATQGEPGVSSNILLPGIVAAGLYGTKKAIEKFERVRGTGEGTKPSVAKPTEVKAPTEKVTPSTIEGEPVAKGKPSVAERAAMGRDALRARMAAAEAEKKAAAEAVSKAKPTEATKPTEAPKAQGEVKPTTKPGNVGSEVSSKVGKLAKGAAKGAAHFTAQAAGAIAAETGAEELARASGVGKTEAQTLATLGVGIPMSVVPALAGTPLAIAALTGYGLGKAIDYGMEASGIADAQRINLAREAMKQNPQLGKGLKDTKEAENAAKEIAAAAKTARTTDYEKGFASPAEAAEFAKKMQDPKFKKQYEEQMRKASEEKMKKIEDASVDIPGISKYVRDPGSINFVDKAGRWLSEKLPSWVTGVEDASSWYDPSQRPSARGMPYEKK